MSTPSLNRHRVVRRTDLNADVFELSVERGDVTFTPGENLTVFNGDETVSRPYSISSGPDESALRFLIRRLPGGVVSNYLGQLSEGDEICATPPFGWFRPGDQQDAPFAFFATGTGIAPFLSYLRAADTRRPVSLLYGVRHRSDAAHVAEIRSAVPGFQLFTSREDADDARRGHLTASLGELDFADGTHFYLCGLDAMIDDVTDALEARGVPFAHIHREVFFHATT